jgi:tetratricopeptide (TPR) repeat protein
MNKTLFNSMVAGILLLGSVVHAKSLPADMVMGKGSSRKVKIIRRDGDWLEFTSGSSTKPVRIGVNAVKELNFNVKISADQIAALVERREFDRIIGSLTRALQPFAEYSDIPNNLTKYEVVLMKLYYRTGKHDKSLEISGKVAEDDRDPELQRAARVYRTLALIASGKMEEAKSMLSEYGWDKESSDDDAPAEELYIKAKLLVLNGEYRQAMGVAAKVVAFHSQNLDWIQPAEMLCAEIYVKLGMYDSADEVCRQIMILYKSAPEFDQAQLLKAEIEKLRAEEVEESLKSEEA